MAFVRVEQRSAHLTGPVKLASVNGRKGKVARGTLTAISNTWRGSGEGRQVQATAIQWILWGRLAENAALYLGKGSHVNIVGRLENNNYEKGGEIVYALDFTCEELDYLDSKAEAEARGCRRSDGPDMAEQGGPSGHLAVGSAASLGRQARSDTRRSANA